jgi:hypothetical protein
MIEDKIYYIDEDGFSWSKYEDYVFNKFHYSNYSDETRDIVVQLLQNLYEAKLKSNNGDFESVESYTSAKIPYERAFVEFFHSILSDKNLVDYGSSPRFVWLTNNGFELIKPMFN